MTQQLIIDALRARTEAGPVRCYCGGWIVVYEGREIARRDHHLNVLAVRRCTRPDRMHQCYMNGFFKAFRVPVRVRCHSGFHLQTKAGSVADLQKEMKLRGYSKVWHGHLLRNIDNMNESDREEFWIELEAQNFYNYDKMTLKNAVTKGVKAWRDRRVGYWLCIDPKTGEYYLLTSANLAELNGLKAMYRLPAVYCRVVLTRGWNVKLGPHVIGSHLDTSAYIEDLDGFFDRIEAKQCTLKR